MSRLSEKKIIKIFQNKLNNGSFVPEDVELFKTGKKHFVVKVDTLVESTDIPPKAKLQDSVRKSLVSCISDFAAKGVKPVFGIVSLTIPKRYSKLNIVNLAVGVKKTAKEFQIKILGGDTNEGKELVISFSLFGFSKKIVKRNGAKINDLIICSGPFGYSKAGLSILLKNKKCLKKFETKAKRAVFRPSCRLDFGLKNKNYFSSSMDSSDGLSTTLNEMSNQSKRKFVITQLPSEKDVFVFANSNRLNVNDLVFNGGEEYEIVATVNPTHIAKIKKYAKRNKIRLYEIGYVTKGRGVFHQKNGKLIRIRDEGWRHFQ
ncbi:Thiamine-monophosphate kinase protein [Marine Group I thaumarchaeote SCGC AAA799-O18]|jgi:thiamine-monophosphate kinase|nr:Thiamine-monophosphate kinase protein [Marine Group I thaumarchaeote SCGC AAA799-O18]